MTTASNDTKRWTRTRQNERKKFCDRTRRRLPFVFVHVFFFTFIYFGFVSFIGSPRRILDFRVRSAARCLRSVSRIRARSVSRSVGRSARPSLSVSRIASHRASRTRNEHNIRRNCTDPLSGRKKKKVAVSRTLSRNDGCRCT